jgi:hypothetical protein
MARRNSHPNILSSIKKYFSQKKHLLALGLEVFLWGGGELIGHFSAYLKTIVWFLAILVLIYSYVPFDKWVKDLLKNKFSKIATRKKLMLAISAAPTLAVAICLCVFAFKPVVDLFTQVVFDKLFKNQLL